MTRLLVANLDCELSWAGPGTGALPAHVRRLVARASAWMAMLGDDGDRLWTMAPIAADAVPPGAPRLSTESGRLVVGDAPVLAWGAASAAGAPEAPSDAGDEPARPWRERLWSLRSSEAVAARVNDRRYGLALAEALGVALPGTRVVSSLGELDATLRDAPLGPGEAWVAKAPWSAAGRERLRRRGRALDGELRVYAERLLARHGSLVIEPWMQRTADLGVCGLVGAPGALCFPAHRMRCDDTGIVRALVVDDAAATGGHHPRLAAIAAEVGAALHADGYRGAFSLDAFAYRDRSGAEALAPLVEINARLTFGHLARAAAERGGAARFELRL